jgi:hypothetical protein
VIWQREHEVGVEFLSKTPHGNAGT